MPYEAQKKLVLGFLLAYLVAGAYVVDRYPFFNWALFTKIPNEQDDFSIEIRSFDGVAYDPALPFSESRFIFDAIGQSPTDYALPVSELGGAVVGGDAAAIAARREYVEKIFAGKEFAYDLVRIVYDPVEKWRTGAYRAREVIASFSSGHE